ncbi:MAG: TM2 domain-containing protein [Akkermansia sp.]
MSATPAVNKVIYCVLAFFLGYIGIHKFYAGKTMAGVLYLLFCWTGIPAILALIDFIVGLCKSSDEQGNITFS